MTTATAELKEKVGPAIGKIASGVHIVTTAKDGKDDGMLATWIAQAGFEPPSLVVSVNKQRDLLKSLAVGDKFTVNILSKGNMEIFKAFAKPHNEGKFESLHTRVTAGGPAFTDAVSYMCATVKSTTEAGDHVVVLGEIFDGELLNGEAEPMIHIRKNGFQY